MFRRMWYIYSVGLKFIFLVTELRDCGGGVVPGSAAGEGWYRDLKRAVPGRQARPQVVTICLIRRLFSNSEAGDWSRRRVCRDKLRTDRLNL